MKFPPGTLFIWTADFTGQDGELDVLRIQRATRDEAVRAAEEHCAPHTRRKLHGVEQDWENATLPEAYPGQPMAERIVSFHSYQASIGRAA